MADTGNRAAQLLVFRLHGREYALPLECVVEVLRMVALTPLPEAPAWLPGVINLRGQLVPVVDLRTRLGLPPRPPDLNTPIVVAEAGGRRLGLIADAMVEVLALAPGLIEPVRSHSSGALDAVTKAVLAIARLEERIVVVLDPAYLRAGVAELPAPE